MVFGESTEGFIERGGLFTPFQYTAGEQSFATYAFAINASGQVLGDYIDDSGNSHGFIYNTNNTFTNIAFEGAANVYAEAINNAGQATGYYFDANGEVHGFLYSGGHVTTLNDPAGAGDTVALAINDGGEVVGYYFDGNGNEEVFTYSNGIYTSIDVPDVNNSIEGVSVNDAGQIVVSYYDNGGIDGVLLNPSTAASTLILSGGTLVTDSTIVVGKGDVLDIQSGADGPSATLSGVILDNSGTAHLQGTATLAIEDMVTFRDAGLFTLAGGTIDAAVTGDTLVNDGNTISGFGQIGDSNGNLTLVNAAGTLEASGGTLDILSNVNNVGGTIAAQGANAVVEMSGVTVTGGTLTTGSAQSNSGGAIEFTGTGNMLNGGAAANSFSISVPTYEPSTEWNDSGIHVVAGEQITITASGSNQHRARQCRWTERQQPYAGGRSQYRHGRCRRQLPRKRLGAVVPDWDHQRLDPGYERRIRIRGRHRHDLYRVRLGRALSEHQRQRLLGQFGQLERDGVAQLTRYGHKFRIHPGGCRRRSRPRRSHRQYWYARRRRRRQSGEP